MVRPAATFQTCLPHFLARSTGSLAEREDAVGRRALVVDAFGPRGELERVMGQLARRGGVGARSRSRIGWLARRHYHTSTRARSEAALKRGGLVSLPYKESRVLRTQSSQDRMRLQIGSCPNQADT
jgi:hypothetical protein